MRFLITAIVFSVASIAQAGGSSRQGEHDKGQGEFEFYYDWYIGVHDNNLGRDTEDDGDLKVRGIKVSGQAELHYKKKWQGVDLVIDYDLLGGLEEAYVSAELPRSYLSFAAGKALLTAAGWQAYTSPYLDYHNPFPTYAPMMRVFAKLESVGELSLMVTNDVMKSDSDKRWFNDDKSVVGLAQYSGDFGIVSPLLQFALYDFKYSKDDDDGKNGWQSWVLTAGVKIALHDLTMYLDYIHDNRKNPDASDDGKIKNSTTVFRNYTAGVSYDHGMLKPWASFSMLRTANDDDRYKGIDGNYMTPADEDKAYDEALKSTFGADSYEDLESYQKYSTNMIAITAGTYIECVKDGFLPYVSYTMKMHKLDPDWAKDAKDSDTENQTSHSIYFGVLGTI